MGRAIEHTVSTAREQKQKRGTAHRARDRAKMVSFHFSIKVGSPFFYKERL